MWDQLNTPQQRKERKIEPSNRECTRTFRGVCGSPIFYKGKVARWVLPYNNNKKEEGENVNDLLWKARPIDFGSDLLFLSRHFLLFATTRPSYLPGEKRERKTSIERFQDTREVKEPCLVISLLEVWGNHNDESKAISTF